MAWTTNYMHQAGNTTVRWKITGSALSLHDCIVAHHYSGRSGIKVLDVTVYRSPTRYFVRTQVVGANPVIFKFSAEKIN